MGGVLFEVTKMFSNGLCERLHNSGNRPRSTKLYP